MLFDWFTIAAQLINFLVLVWLLRRFLYKPVLNAIDERERKISTRLQQAETLQAQATEQRDRFAAKNAALEQQRETLLREAGTAAQAERERLLDQARQDAATLRAKQTQALQHDADVTAKSIKQRTQQEVLAIARKALAELSSVTLEQRMVEAFIARLQSLDAAARGQLANSLNNRGTVQICSASALQPTQQQQLTQQVQQLLGHPVNVEYSVTPTLLCGIELITDGHKLDWNLAALIDSLHDSLDDSVGDSLDNSSNEQLQKS
jgi:F-type H+-transporting ATPase subunit b